MLSAKGKSVLYMFGTMLVVAEAIGSARHLKGKGGSSGQGGSVIQTIECGETVNGTTISEDDCASLEYSVVNYYFSGEEGQNVTIMASPSSDIEFFYVFPLIGTSTCYLEKEPPTGVLNFVSAKEKYQISLMHYNSGNRVDGFDYDFSLTVTCNEQAPRSGKGSDLFARRRLGKGKEPEELECDKTESVQLIEEADCVFSAAEGSIGDMTIFEFKASSKKKQKVTFSESMWGIFPDDVGAACYDYKEKTLITSGEGETYMIQNFDGVWDGTRDYNITCEDLPQ